MTEIISKKCPRGAARQGVDHQSKQVSDSGLIHSIGLVALVVILASGCEKPVAAVKKAEAPANVPNIPKEDKLNDFELTPKAEERLGIVTAPIEKRATVRMRTYGSEVVLPTGASLIVAAPLAGFLQPPKNGGIPAVGARVRKGQPIYALVPQLNGKSIFSPAEKLSLLQARLVLEQARTEAEGQVQQTTVQVDAAKIALERAERLLKGDVGTKRVVDEATAALSLAEKAYGAAAARKKLLDNMRIDEGAGDDNPLVVDAPQDGVIRVEHAKANEAVAAGAPLFEVMNTSLVWVKVPVYVGELAEIAEDQPARLTSLEDRHGSKGVMARPVGAPPTAIANASTVDLYYEIENGDGKFRPGQKVNASLPLREERESLVVPWSAIVFDINGGSWVYESLGAHKYARRRVQVKYVVDATAVLASGPAVGAKVVTEGAAEVFGTEFGFGK